MSTEPLTHRRRQALETRARIVRAARAVFAEQGYGAATIAGVAEAAGVAQPTVYKLFRNKRALLSAIADEWIGQVGIGQLQPAASPREAIAGWAATIRRQWELGLDIGLVYAGAVTSEPEVEAELQPRLAARERAIRAVAASLRPGLRPGVTVEGAIAVISALSLPEVYRELVRDRRWSPRAFQRWLEGTLAALLLQPD